jgi:hypothetical protein
MQDIGPWNWGPPLASREGRKSTGRPASPFPLRHIRLGDPMFDSRCEAGRRSLVSGSLRYLSGFEAAEEIL